jgi:hypothetical protein
MEFPPNSEKELPCILCGIEKCVRKVFRLPKPKNFDEDGGIQRNSGVLCCIYTLQICAMNKKSQSKSVMLKFVVNCRIEAGKVV